MLKESKVEMNKILLELKHINKRFFNNKVLDDVDFQLMAGEIHCLAGENGAGKSTIVKILTGVYDYEGDIYVSGEKVNISSPLVSREKGIFAVQQHRDLVPTLNAVENIFLGNFILKDKNNSIDYKTMKEKALAYFDQFKINIDTDVPVSELEVGQHGIIAICKALISNGKILIMDEASAPLDNFERHILYNVLKKLREENKGIIYITHHLEEMFEIGDKITILRNGCNVGLYSTNEINREKLISCMTGDKKLYSRIKRQEAAEEAGTEKNALLECSGISSEDISDISFMVEKGEVVGFAGIDGSGKETIAEVIYGLKDRRAGEIRYRNRELNIGSPIQAIREGIGLVPTDRLRLGIIPCRGISENISLPIITRKKKKIISSKWMCKLAADSIKSLGIKAVSPTQLIEYLSGGNQQKVLIGKWIHAESDLLFLIEPTEGIDVGARADMYRVLNEMAKTGKTLIIFSSDIDELLTLCDRIYTMSQGRILNEYNADKVTKNQILSDILTKQENRVV